MKGGAALGIRLLEKIGGKAIYVHEELSPPPGLGRTPQELGLDARLSAALAELGISRLYRFQEEAYKHISEGKDVMIVAGTGTGKTEAFLVPLIEMALRSDSRPAALLIYPTKALARDQMKRMEILERATGVRAAVLDGDVPQEERDKIYSDPPHLLVTNPDMIHYSLDRSALMRDLIRRAEVAVFDEFHIYDGIFGSHLAWLTRRMLMLSDLSFVGVGATIGNPEEIGRRIFGKEVAVVRGPQRRKGIAYHYLVEGAEQSRWGLAASLIRELTSEGMKVLSFTDSQQMAEFLARLARKRGVRAEVHRAGLEASHRRRVEQGFAEGIIDAVVATSTLELGIDIGSVDAVVMPTMPPSSAAYLQRAGRAGRRERPGYIFTILGDNPLEAYFASRPQEFFSRELPPMRVEPANPEVALLHIAATITAGGRVTEKLIPPGAESAIEDIISGKTEAGRVLWREGNEIRADRRALQRVLESRGLRYTGPPVMIVALEGERKRKIGFREMPMALLELYPGAIYYHAGTPYVVTRLELGEYVAYVRRLKEADRYTKPLYRVGIEAIEPIAQREVRGVKVTYGKLLVSLSVSGYVVRLERGGGHQVFLDKPLSWSYWTRGFMGLYPGAARLGERAIDAFHALEHVLISASEIVAKLADRDLSGVSYPTGHIAIYDSVVGGSGASWLAFQRLEEAVEVAEKILAGCSCEDGCPRCIYSPYCGNNNEMLSRKGALEVVKMIKRGEPAIPAPLPLSQKSLA